MTMDRVAQALADLVRHDEPRALDARFRLAVLERRAQQIFRRRLAATLCTALAFGLGLAFAMQASADAMEIGVLLIAGGGLVLSWRGYAPVLAHWMRARLSESK
jgi:hypothetical protein